MPFSRISVPAGKGADFTRAIGDAVHNAMVEAINVPADDRFQVISEHTPDEMLFDFGYLAVDRSDDCVLVHCTMKRGRTPTQKKALYAKIADNLQALAGHRRQDAVVILTENELSDWSFGNGEAQIANE